MVGMGRPMDLARRLLGAQAASGRRMGSACLDSWPAWLGFGPGSLALSPDFGILEQARAALTG